jgi:hypothetical protein
MTGMVNYDDLPERLCDGMRRYLEQRIKPGDFLTAVLSNDLVEAIVRADEDMLEQLPAIIGWLLNEPPAICWGSSEKVRKWLT